MRENTIHLIARQCLLTVPDNSQILVWKGFEENEVELTGKAKQINGL